MEKSFSVGFPIRISWGCCQLLLQGMVRSAFHYLPSQNFRVATTILPAEQLQLTFLLAVQPFRRLMCFVETTGMSVAA